MSLRNLHFDYDQRPPASIHNLQDAPPPPPDLSPSSPNPHSNQRTNPISAITDRRSPVDENFARQASQQATPRRAGNTSHGNAERDRGRPSQKQRADTFHFDDSFTLRIFESDDDSTELEAATGLDASGSFQPASNNPPPGYQTYQEDNDGSNDYQDNRIDSEEAAPFSQNFIAALKTFCWKKPSWNRISSYIVRNAPCFWCANRQNSAAATDRSILLRLNILCSVFAFVQVAVGIFWYILLVGDEPNQIFPNMWNLNGTFYILAILDALLAFAMLVSLKAIRQVNINGASRFLWALYWIVPLELVLVLSLFDYHRVMEVWVKHWWTTSSMENIRTWFCKEGTADTLCNVPELGGAEYANEKEWCIANYNATDCEAIRNNAQVDARTLFYIFFTANAVVGLVLIALLVLALNLLEGMIGLPLVQSNKESNIPAWLTLPTIGCFGVGTVIFLTRGSVVSDQDWGGDSWIGAAYLLSGACFFISIVLGWFLSVFSVLNTRDKRTKQIAVNIFISVLILTILGVAAIFLASVMFSSSLVGVQLSDTGRATVACALDQGRSCTGCHDESIPEGDRCPEYNDDDVLRMIQTQLKLSATLAAIFFGYAVNALRYGVVLRNHISNYQIDYV